jgi:hypothetical protein
MAMSCDAVSLSLTLWMAALGPAPDQAPVMQRELAIATPPSVAQEPLFSDIVRRAGGLKARVEALRTAVPAAGDLEPLPGFDAFSKDVAALSALDMEGHLELAKRGVVDDLKCILRGIAQDLPARLKEVADAKDLKARDLALREMIYLLNDNVEVITAPPRPAA